MNNAIRIALAFAATLAVGHAIAAPDIRQVVADSAAGVRLHQHREPMAQVIQIAPVEVVLAFTLDGEGAVTAMKVVRSTASDPDVGRNVAEGVKAGLIRAALKNVAGNYSIPVIYEGDGSLTPLAARVGLITR